MNTGLCQAAIRVGGEMTKCTLAPGWIIKYSGNAGFIPFLKLVTVSIMVSNGLKGFHRWGVQLRLSKRRGPFIIYPGTVAHSCVWMCKVIQLSIVDPVF